MNYYEVLEDAIELVDASKVAFCHFITPNDIGLTGGHQCGYYFPHYAEPMFYGKNQVKGSNDEIWIDIRWQKSFTTHSRAVYYGTATRNENRITNFGRGFEFMQPDYLGSLMIITKTADSVFDCYVLTDQQNIENFLSYYNLSLTERNQMIQKELRFINPEDAIQMRMQEIVNGIDAFPNTITMACLARDIVNGLYDYSNRTIVTKCDSILTQWIDIEYKLLACMEEKLYKHRLSQQFSSCQELIDFSKEILNRRKARAGKSLEHHLATIFTAAELKFEEQVVTEENKKPDFIFPDGESYHNILFPAEQLVFLGAKTTCKDRWRQIINEADRIDNKHLFTLQPGVSENQLREMRDEHVTLVVPKDNVNLFHPKYRDNILDLKSFIQMVREKQAI